MRKTLAILSIVLMSFGIAGCGIELGGGHVIIDVVCDPPVSVQVAYQPGVGSPTITVWSYDFDLEQWLNEQSKGPEKQLVPILVAAVKAECEGLEL